jgi:hypothetical protein
MLGVGHADRNDSQTRLFSAASVNTDRQCHGAAIADKFGAQIVLSLSRIEAKSLSEKMHQHEGGGLSQIPGSKPESEVVRAIEFTGLLRPDHAKIIMQIIQRALRTLPLEKRQQYEITDADLGPELQTPQI